MNASSNQLGLKKHLIEHLISYRTIFVSLKSDNNQKSYEILTDLNDSSQEIKLKLNVMSGLSHMKLSID